MRDDLEVVNVFGSIDLAHFQAQLSAACYRNHGDGDIQILHFKREWQTVYDHSIFQIGVIVVADGNVFDFVDDKGFQVKLGTSRASTAKV